MPKAWPRLPAEAAEGKGKGRGAGRNHKVFGEKQFKKCMRAPPAAGAAANAFRRWHTWRMRAPN